jgi:AcrR family transcriptional regulator
MVEAIVEAAACILEERGHDGFSTNAVAEKAGVSVGSLYQYFPHKDALIGALIQRETTAFAEDVENTAAMPIGEDVLLALLHHFVEQQMRRPALARLLDFEEARLPLDAEAKRIKARFFELVRNALERSDLLLLPDSGVATRDVLAIIKGMVDAAGRHGDEDVGGLSLRVRFAVVGYLKMANDEKMRS